MALVISTGGIDLSVGSVMAIAGQVGALLIVSGAGAYVAWGGALLAALVCGVFNGVLVARFGVQPIIATLILLIAGRGIAQLITGGNLQDFDDPLFQAVGLGRAAGLPMQVAICAVVALVIFAVVRWTTLGRYLLAVGGNERSAGLAGVPGRQDEDAGLLHVGRAGRDRGAHHRRQRLVLGREQHRPRHRALRDRRRRRRRHPAHRRADERRRHV